MGICFYDVFSSKIKVRPVVEETQFTFCGITDPAGILVQLLMTSDTTRCCMIVANLCRC